MEVIKTDEFVAWFEKLRDPKARAAIVSRIDRIEVLGNFGDYKTLRDGISELRIKSGPGYRIYFAKRGNMIILLLNAGDKSSQSRDIDKAKKLNDIYKVKENSNENSD